MWKTLESNVRLLVWNLVTLLNRERALFGYAKLYLQNKRESLPRVRKPANFLGFSVTRAHSDSRNALINLLRAISEMATRSTRLRKRPPPSPQPEQQSRAKWTASLTQILVDLMVDRVRTGNKKNNSFGKKEWKYIHDEFSKKTGLKWEKEQLKYRYAGLRKQHGIVKSLLDCSDFKWDEMTGAIVAEDQVWAKYIKEHPDADTVRTGGCPMYNQLCTIFSEPSMNGEFNGLSDYKEGNPNTILCPQPLNTFREETTSESEEGAGQCIVSPSTVGSKRGRKGIDNVIARAILEMAAASKMRTVAIEQYNDRYTITGCVRALDAMQGVDERVYYAALDLFEKRGARETFLSLKDDKRLAWLSSKCSSLSNS